MDLLRLVLVHQPAEKLWRMPRLLKPAFLRTKADILDYTDTGHLIPDTTRNGDVSELSVIYLDMIFLKDRSVFLRDSNMFGKMSRISLLQGDFWNEIASGIPEIQAWAITARRVLLDNSDPGSMELLGIGDSDSHVFLRGRSLNDPLSIPWTPQLFAALRPVLSRSLDTEYQFGYFSLSRYVVNRDGDFDHFIGFCHQRLGGQETVEINPPIGEKYRELVRKYGAMHAAIAAMHGGYCRPILEFIGNPEGTLFEIGDIYKEITEEAFRAASHIVLRRLLSAADVVILANQTYLEKVIPVWYRAKVAKILSDPAIRSRMSPSVFRQYSILIGEVPGRLVNQSIYLVKEKLRVGIPSIVRWPDWINPLSLQGTAYYDPQAQSTGSDTLQRDKYRKLARVQNINTSNLMDILAKSSYPELWVEFSKLAGIKKNPSTDLFYRRTQFQKIYNEVLASLTA